MKWNLPAADTYFASILEADPIGFEIDHLNEAMKYVRRVPNLAIDCGAHIGTWSINMAPWFRSVVAIEPAEDTFECLVKNIKAAGLLNITPIYAAAGSEQTFGRVVDDPTRVGNTGARMVSTQGAVVRVLTIDSFDLKHVDFIKLDVEGSEELVLRGAVNTIQRWHPTLMVELKTFSPQRHNGVHGTRQFLAQLGYREVGGIRNDRVFQYFHQTPDAN